MFVTSVALMIYIDRRHAPKENEICWLVLKHAVQLLQYPVPVWATTPSPVGLPCERPLRRQHSSWGRPGQRDLVPTGRPACLVGTFVRSLEPWGCWDGNTAWRIPRHQWRHRSWGAAVLVPRLVGTGSHRQERRCRRWFRQINGLRATELLKIHQQLYTPPHQGSKFHRGLNIGNIKLSCSNRTLHSR